MKYTDVVKLLKQAAIPMGAASPAAVQARTKTVKTPAPPPKAPDNTFSNGIAAAQKQRQQQINAANRQFTQTTGHQPRLTNAQANQIIDDSIRKQTAQETARRQADDAEFAKFTQQQRAQNQARAAKVNETIARQQAADAARRQRELNPQPQTRPDTLHASPSTAGKRMGAIEAERAKANREFQIRDAARQDAALTNGTMKTRGSGSITAGGKTTSFGQPIQRDANGQTIRQPANNAKPVRQSIINGMVYDHFADGSQRQNQALTEQYATTGQKPVLIQNQQSQQARRPAAKPAVKPVAAPAARPAARPVAQPKPQPRQQQRISTTFSTGPAKNMGPGKPVSAPAIKPVTRQPISPPRNTTLRTVRVKR